MAVSPHFTKTLRQAIGEEASEELIGMFATNTSDHAAIRGDIAELRHEMNVGFEKARSDIVERTERLRSDLVERIEGRFSDLLKWSFVFWVGAISTIAVLFRALR